MLNPAPEPTRDPDIVPDSGETTTRFPFLLDRLIALTAGVPTGAKVFLILSAALLPLALIAVYASLQSSRIADQEVAARLRVAAAESSRALTIELGGDLAALRSGLAALSRDPLDAAACARAQGVYAAQATMGVRFAISDAAGRTLCGGGVPPDALPALNAEPRDMVLLPDRGLVMRLAPAQGDDVRGVAYFPVAFLASVARPSGFLSDYGAELVLDDQRLVLETLEPGGLRDRNNDVTMELGLSGLRLDMQIRGTPITATLILAMLLPLLMWFAAAAIAWFVVDLLLIRPLRRLRRVVGAYQPGDQLAHTRFGSLSAREIRELGETFRAITITVRAHEAGLAEGLVRQTRLTREVHHRVKNNLQVIASLINFHARSARDEATGDAYASIQRRVDALAVVHRHHYAELEENRGLELRAVIGELAANLRANAPERAARMAMSLNVDPVLVTQDVAVAVAFLVTELVELAMDCSPAGHVGISVRMNDAGAQACVRVSSPGLIDTPQFQTLMETRYGRIITGLARQLRASLHHDPLAGVFEIMIAARPAA